MMLKILFRYIFNTNQKFRNYLARYYNLEDVLSFNDKECEKTLLNFLDKMENPS